jgi:hypothetical protein
MKKWFIAALLILLFSLNAFGVGKVIVQNEWTYENLAPTVISAYKALSCLPNDLLLQTTGSSIGSSITVSENFNSNNGTISIWYYPYNYGNAGQLRYLYDCYVDANNRISLYIGADNNLTLSISGNGTIRTASTSLATIKPFTWNHIVATWSKNTTVNSTNYSYIYLNGTGAGQTSATVAMTSNPTTFSIGSDYAGQNSANGLIAYKIYRYWLSSTEVTALYNSGNGSLNSFTVTPHCIALGLAGESSTGIKYHHVGQAISTISTVTLTTTTAVGGRGFANGDRVVVWDDADPPNVVRTTINGTPSGSTIIVADSCAGIVGTNKFISKNLIVDPFNELTTTSAWTATGATLSKNTTANIADARDFKLVNTGAAQGKATQTLTTAQYEDYYIYGLMKPTITETSGNINLTSIDGTASMSQAIPDLTSGLVGWWKINEATAVHGTTIADSSGSGNNGTLSTGDGATEKSAVGEFSKAISFDGVDDYVDVGNSDIFDSNLQYTYSAWIYPKTITSGYKAIIVHRNSGASSVVGLWAENDSLYVSVKNDGRKSTVTGNVFTLALNTWQHVVLTVDAGGVVKVWLNSVSVTVGTIVGPFTDFDTPLYIGRHYGSSPQYWNGLIDDVRIYNRALSAGEVANLYALRNETIEIEHCFQAQDADTTVDLTVPGAVSGEIAYWDNVKVLNSKVVNGGCEGGANPPTSWVQETNATVISDTSPHAGTNCLKVTAGANAVGASQAVTLVSGQYYTVGSFLKATSGDTIGLYMDYGNGVVQTIGTVTATTWTRVRGSFKALGTAGVMYIRCVTNTDIGWADDLAIIRDDSASALSATKGGGILPLNQPMLLR